MNRPIDMIRAERASLLCRVVEKGAMPLQLALNAAAASDERQRAWLPDAISDVCEIAAECEVLKEPKDIQPFDIPMKLSEKT